MKLQLFYTKPCKMSRLFGYFFGGDFWGIGVYSNLACSATIDRRVDEAPLGSYNPISHSLIVCWRVPSLSASSRWVKPRWRRKAWMWLLSHFIRFALSRLFMTGFYTIQGKSSKWGDCLLTSPHSGFIFGNPIPLYSVPFRNGVYPPYPYQGENISKEGLRPS